MIVKLENPPHNTAVKSSAKPVYSGRSRSPPSAHLPQGRRHVRLRGFGLPRGHSRQDRGSLEAIREFEV